MFDTSQPQWQLRVALRPDGSVSRRRWLRATAGTALGGMLLGRLGAYAEQVKASQKRCILVWLAGGPSQFESWDPKPGEENGGSTQAIASAVAGIQVAEYWPRVAAQMKDVALLRSLTNKEGSHERATYHLHTGRRPTGALKFPNFGCVAAQQLGAADADLPNFVSLGATVGSGFLGAGTQPFVVSRPGQLPDNVRMLVQNEQMRRRFELLVQQDIDFASDGATELAKAHYMLYQQAARMMKSPRLRAFELADEPKSARDAYGDNRLGNSLLVARRLAEAGVPFVEVRQGGWDNHQGIYDRLPNNAATVDRGLATLLADLRDRGLLEHTLVVCLGEFGRTPKINDKGGRDHWPNTFSAAVAGCGTRGGQVIGATSADGTEIADRPIGVEDLFQSFCQALDIDPDEQLESPAGRPLAIVDGGQPIDELFA